VRFNDGQKIMLKSMIRKSGNRFSEKIMLYSNELDHDPIPSERSMV